MAEAKKDKFLSSIMLIGISILGLKYILPRINIPETDINVDVNTPKIDIVNNSTHNLSEYEKIIDYIAPPDQQIDPIPGDSDKTDPEQPVDQDPDTGTTDDGKSDIETDPEIEPPPPPPDGKGTLKSKDNSQLYSSNTTGNDKPYWGAIPKRRRTNLRGLFLDMIDDLYLDGDPTWYFSHQQILNNEIISKRVSINKNDNSQNNRFTQSNTATTNPPMKKMHY